MSDWLDMATMYSADRTCTFALLPAGQSADGHLSQSARTFPCHLDQARCSFIWLRRWLQLTLIVSPVLLQAASLVDARHN